MKGVSILEISKAQIEGKLPETAQVSAIPTALAAVAPITFALFTPLGLFASYLVLSGLLRVVASYVDEAHGDPILGGADWLWRRVFTSRQQRSVRVARQKLERMDEPDRRYDGDWAGLSGVDFVIVSSRRKPGWTKGRGSSRMTAGSCWASLSTGRCQTGFARSIRSRRKPRSKP